MSSTREVLDTAANAIKRGDIAQGKKGLLQVLDDEPDNVLAWLWMSRCMDTNEAKLKCFHRVLRIEPTNEHALNGIRTLPERDQPPKESSSATERDSTVTAGSPDLPKARKLRGPLMLVFGVSGGIGLCICALFTLGTLSAASTGVGVSGKNGPTSGLTQPTVRSSPTWVVYRLVYSASAIDEFRWRVVSAIWENNTGGTDSDDRLVGDGSCSSWGTCEKPDAWGYTMSLGDFAYLSAQLQSEAGYGGELVCEIYITDDAGVDALVHGGNVPSGLEPWKKSACGGDYCICTASGIVGYD